MKIEIESSDLLSLVQDAAKATASRPINPVLKGIKLTAQDEVVTAVGTDLDLACCHTVKAKVLRAGVCLVAEPDRLVKVLKEHGGLVSLSCDGESLLVKVYGGKYNLPVGNPDEMPEFPESSGKVVLSVPAESLLRSLRQVENAASKSDTSPRFTVKAVLFDVGDGMFSLVATDTKRLHQSEVAKVEAEWPGNVLVPLRTVEILKGALKGWAGEVTIAASANDVQFTAGGSRVWSRLVEGRYPAWRSYLPKKYEVEFPLDVAEFSDKTEKAAITTDFESKRVNYSFQAGKVLMSSVSPEVGSSEVEMTLPNSELEYDIAFDPLYVKHAASAFLESGADECTLCFSGQHRPALFKWDGGLSLVIPLGERE